MALFPFNTAVTFDFPAVGVGGSGKVTSNKVSFEPEIGPPIDRRRSSFTTRTVGVELQPMTQEQYQAFLDWFNINRNSEFYFPDPITKVNQNFKFANNREPFKQTRMTSGHIKVTFELIRVFG